ncbi:MAG TPA: hypothetical protein VIM58_08545, partial [Candidatus Methylacidiphilales bacterium]
MGSRILPGLLLCLAGTCAAVAAPAPAIDADLTGVPYPYPVSFFELPAPASASASSAAEPPAPAPLRMAYMDVPPDAKKANGQTVVLLHGKNFAGYSPYWDNLIAALTAAGYR